MKTEYTCKQCGETYFSYKERSEFCSMDCKRAWRSSITYDCDNCGKTFIVAPSKLKALTNGKHKSLFCSVDCANDFQTTKVTKTCENCGASFQAYHCWKDSARFCSRKCYEDYKSAHKKIFHKVCPICQDAFITTRSDQIYCSVACRSASTQKRQTVICDICGKQFKRIESEMNKSSSHYCSIECRNAGMYWSEQDTQILVDNFGKLSYEEITRLVSDKWDIEAVRRKAIYLGLTQSREWSKDEIEIISKYYSNITMPELMDKLPKRTYSSILRKARELNLKSYFFLTSLYSKEENKFIQENYLVMTNEELGAALHRSANGIGQHLWVMGLRRPKDVGHYNDLIEYMRSRLYLWKTKYKEECNYTCALTNSRSNIVVHHIYSFNLLFKETCEALNFPIYEDFSAYTQTELDYFVESFLCLQESYGEYVCITESIHKLFHKLYGYGYNTREQWDDFVNLYNANKI